MDIQTLLMQTLSKNNPQLAQVLDELNKSGKSPKELFYEKAKQMGVNPDDVLKTLQSFNNK